MATPTFEAKKVGDQYVVVPTNAPATPAGSSCLLLGATLLLAGALKRGLIGVTLTGIGGTMLYRAATGATPWAALLCGRKRAGGPSGQPKESPSFPDDDRPSGQVPEDEVDEAAMESFPASDPPAHTPTTSP